MTSKAIVSDWAGPDPIARAAAKERATLVCTASDAGFFPLFEELLASLDAAALPPAWKLGVLDLGLTARQADMLRARGAIVQPPGWRLALPMPAATPNWFCGFAARPFLPQIFPGFDIYLQVDADAYVLDGGALFDYAAAAMNGEYAVAFEHFGPGVHLPITLSDGRPAQVLLNEASVRAAVERCYVANFGAEYAWCAREFICNNGIWALRGDVAHWATWADYLARALRDGQIHKLSEQQSMCLALLEGAIPVRRMPNTHNWNIAAKLPMMEIRNRIPTVVDPDNGNPLGILHLTDLKHLRQFNIPVRQGGFIALPLRYRDLPPVMRKVAA